MRFEDGGGTSAKVLEDNVPVVESIKPARSRTVRRLTSWPSGTSTVIPSDRESESQAEILPTIPEEAIAPNTVRGKSLAQWGIERRQAAKALKEQWQDEVGPTAGTPAFAVLASGFTDRIDRLIELYTGIDYEEVFTGILLLVRDALIGRDFLVAAEGRLTEPLLAALDVAIGSTGLSMKSYDEVLGKFIVAGFTDTSGR